MEGQTMTVETACRMELALRMELRNGTISCANYVEALRTIEALLMASCAPGRDGLPGE